MHTGSDGRNKEIQNSPQGVLQKQETELCDIREKLQIATLATAGEIL